MAGHPPPRRRDAERNRQAILTAARTLLARSGDVPMYEIGRSAGVGQATLYRHFRAREDLVLAIFSEQLAELETVAQARRGDPDAFLDLLRTIVEMQARYHGLVDCLRWTTGAGLRQRLERAMSEPLATAASDGRLRADASIDDLHLITGMVDGALRSEHDPTARARIATRVVALALNGLTRS
jgi:AcrR family transcriptional regulator